MIPKETHLKYEALKVFYSDSIKGKHMHFCNAVAFPLELKHNSCFNSSGNLLWKSCRKLRTKCCTSDNTFALPIPDMPRCILKRWVQRYTEIL